MPNITGQCSNTALVFDGWGSYDGCFDVTRYSEYGVSSSGRSGTKISFSASNGETLTDGTIKSADDYKIYGSSNHVTPYNVTIKVWKRIN